MDDASWNVKETMTDMDDFDEFDGRCDSIFDSGISVSYLSSNEFSNDFSNNLKDSKIDSSISKLNNLSISDCDDGYASISTDSPSFPAGFTLKSLSSQNNDSSISTCNNTVNNTTWQDQYGDTKLHTSIIHEKEDISLEIIFMSSSHDLEIQNDCLQTPLHLAVITNQPTTVAKLVSSGVKTNIRERNGNTALNIACDKGYIDCINAMYSLSDQNYVTIEQLKSDATLLNYHGETCLHLALKSRNMDLITHLCKFGVNMNLNDGLSGKSILHTMVDMNNVEINNLVILQNFINNCNPDFNTRTFAGLTAIQIAKSRHHNNVVELLKECGSDDHSISDFSSSDSESDMLF